MEVTEAMNVQNSRTYTQQQHQQQQQQHTQQ